MNYLGDFPTDATVYVYFHTFNSSGASVTLTGLATSDIEIYKNGSTTQRSSDAGYTLLDTDGIDFDSLTGIHGFSIDTSDNTDAGFYAAGNEYAVVVSSVTVDSQTVSFVAATFSIERSGGALALLKNATYGLSAIETLVDDLETRLTAARAGYLDNLNGHTAQTGDNYARLGAPAGASVSADIAAVKSDTGATLTDTNELQTDWTNGGRLDLIVDAILADTGTDGVVLANDAITSAKYDESTAFPIKSADTGATQIARVGADSDTLKTLSDQLDTVGAVEGMVLP